jgi:hypothetical protein
MSFAKKDTEIIRTLANRLAEIAALPVQQENKKLWIKLNRLKRTRPLIYINACEPSLWEEIMPDSQLQCGDPFCRDQERYLRRQIFCWDNFPDDRVIEAVVPCWYIIEGDSRIDGFGVFNETDQTQKHGAKHFKSVIDKEEDIEKIKKPKIEVFREETLRNADKLKELYDGILQVEIRGPNFFWLPVGDIFAQWRGLDRIYMDIVERPDWLHACLEKITEGHISSIKQLEAEGVLSPNGPNDLGSGGFSWTDELPQEGSNGQTRLKDLWVRLSTQMFTEVVSKETHYEFAVQYEERIAEHFGLTAYGCCEPLHERVDMLKGIKNLRRVSMSPYVDIDKGSEALGKNYVYSFKPHPSNLAMPSWDPGLVQREIESAYQKTRNNIVDVTLQDLLTVRGQVQRITEWSRIARDLAMKYA